MMNISFGPHGDFPINTNLPGSYEWWYFDAVDIQQDIACTIILFNGMPMSPYYLEAAPNAFPSEFSGYAISLYHKGRKLAGLIHHTENCEIIIDDESLKVKTGNVICNRRNSNEYELSIDTYFPEIAKSIKGTLKFTSVFPLSKSTVSGDESHTWKLVAPVCNVQGNLTLSEYGDDGMSFDFDCLGYHDSNAGNKPLYNDYNDWYWGRTHFPNNKTLVYYYYPASTNTATLQLGYLIDSYQQTLEAIQDLTITENKKKIHKGGLSVSRALSIEGIIAGSPITFTVEHSKTPEFSPFYYRFLTSTTYQHKGITLQSNDGIAEYFKASSLQSAFTRMLIKTPIVKASN